MDSLIKMENCFFMEWYLHYPIMHYNNPWYYAVDKATTGAWTKGFL